MSRSAWPERVGTRELILRQTGAGVPEQPAEAWGARGELEEAFRLQRTMPHPHPESPALPCLSE